MRTYKKWIGLWLILVLSACQMLPAPPPTTTHTITPGPSPTPTSSPTSTPLPTPEPVVRIDSGDKALWQRGRCAQVERQGVLRLRADGMGWGEIAHTVGVKPGQGFKPTHVPPADGVVTPYGGAHRVRVEERARVREQMDGSGNQIRTRSELRTRTEARSVVTAAGGAPVSGTEARGHKGAGTEIAHRHGGRALGSGIVTAAGAPAVGGPAARGAEARIQRGGGAEAVHGGGRQAASGSGVVSAAGSTVAMNAGSRSGGGNGGGKAHAGGKR